MPTDVSDLTDTTNLLIPWWRWRRYWFNRLSVTQNAGSGTGTPAYNSTTGVFTYTPPDLSGYSTFDGDYNNLTNTPIQTDVSDPTDTNLLSGGGGGGATALDDLSDVDIPQWRPSCHLCGMAPLGACTASRWRRRCPPLVGLQQEQTTNIL